MKKYVWEEDEMNYEDAGQILAGNGDGIERYWDTTHRIIRRLKALDELAKEELDLEDAPGDCSHAEQSKIWKRLVGEIIASLVPCVDIIQNDKDGEYDIEDMAWSKDYSHYTQLLYHALCLKYGDDAVTRSKKEGRFYVSGEKENKK